MKRFLKAAAVLLILCGLVAGAAWSYMHRAAAPVEVYKTAQIQRGDLVSQISSTGTLEPEEVIDVGAQVAGQILSFGRDQNGKSVDYGSSVKAGTVLAHIDDSLYTSDVAQSQASLVQAEANVQRAEADLGQLEAKLQQAESDWKRAQQLGPSDALAQSSYDAYKAAYETAKSNLAVGEATVAQGKGAVAQAEAALGRVQRNLGYCTIVSPVDGVIIDRRVNIGQTVVASLNAPSLFLIAKDLRRMQIWVPVNEADIASIHPGQTVDFTADAVAGQTFRGKVVKVRLNAAMTQNVVTYTVEVAADNSSGKLLPYLTANVRFEVAQRSDVLMVPNAALSWTPAPEQIAPRFRSQLDDSGRHNRQTVSGPRAGATKDRTAGRPATVWLQADDGLIPLKVRAGLTDGSMTEIAGQGVEQGLAVVVGEARAQAAAAPSSGSNPFTPQIGRGARGGARGAR